MAACFDAEPGAIGLSTGRPTELSLEAQLEAAARGCGARQPIGGPEFDVVDRLGGVEPAHQVRHDRDIEQAELRKWFFEFDAENWDKQIERDSISGRLANLAKKSLEDHQGGTSTDL